VNTRRLVEAAEANDVGTIVNMLDRNLVGDMVAEVNANFEDDYTALHYAAN
jgi:hypothetical protein